MPTSRLQQLEASFADAAQKKAWEHGLKDFFESLREHDDPAWGLKWKTRRHQPAIPFPGELPHEADPVQDLAAGRRGRLRLLGASRRPQDRRCRCALGGAAQYGAAIRNGFQLAAEQINAAGGINGDKIQLVVEDEQGKKEEGINVFKADLPGQGADGVRPDAVELGAGGRPDRSGFQDCRVPAPRTRPTASPIGDYVFRNSVTEADVLPETLKMAVRKANVRKVAVIYGNDDVFTKSGYDNFKKALADLNIPVTTTETFAKGDVDFKAQLTKIKAGNP